MSFGLSVAFLEATHVVPGKDFNRGEGCLSLALGAGALNSLVRLEHVLDVPFEHEQIRRSLAIDLQRATIIPLDCSFNLFTIK